MVGKVVESTVTAAFGIAALLALGWAVRQGWLPAMGMGVLAVGYVVFACFSVGWAIQAGGEASGQRKPLLGNLLYWHGVGVVVTLIMAAAATIAYVAGSLVLRGMP